MLFICITICFITNPLTTPKRICPFQYNPLTSPNKSWLLLCITMIYSFICIPFCFVANLLTTPKGMRRFLSNPLTSLNYNVLFICITISFVINPLTALKNNC